MQKNEKPQTPRPLPPTARPLAVARGEALIAVPISELPLDGYVSRRLDIQLSPAQASAARRIAIGLDEQQAQLKSGKRVTTIQHAVCWLLEKALSEVSEKSEA